MKNTSTGGFRHLWLAKVPSAWALMWLGAGASIAADEVWIGTTSGAWSVNAKWLDGSAPAAGGDPELAVRFEVSGTTPITATNDRGSPFLLNELIFDSSSSGLLTVASAAGNNLQFSGVDPAIGLYGSGDVRVSSAIMLGPDSGSVLIDGVGAGNLTLSGVIGENGLAGSLVIEGAPPTTNTQIVTLSGANTFSGGVRLNSGNLSLGSVGALGSGGLTVSGGTLRLNSAFALSNPIALNSELVIVNAGGATLTRPISSNLPNTGLSLRSNGGTLTLSAVSSYSGPTTIDYAAGGAGTLRLSGNAALSNTSAIGVRADGMLQIDALSGATDRLPDTAPVELRSGRVLFSGAAGTNAQTETIGTLSGAGYSRVDVAPLNSGTGSIRLTAASLTRLERGTFFFRAPGLGNAFGAGMGNVLFQQPPTGLIGGGGPGANVNILPYAVGASTTTGGASGLVTYEPATGVRLLNDATEYTASLETAAPTHNVRLTSATTNDSDVIINALVLADNATVSGSGGLRVTSGALLKAQSILTTGTIANRLDFGSTEANVFVASRSDSLVLSGSVAGTAGLTKSGDGLLRLSAVNSFSGPLTINSGQLEFATVASLGTDSGAIAINGYTAINVAEPAITGLAHIGATAATLARDLQLNSGVAELRPGAGLALAGTISGSGGLRVSSLSSADGFVVLPNANSFAGPTVIDGRLAIGSDASLGSNATVTLRDTLRLDGPWTSTRTLEIGGFYSQVDTNGFNATLNAPVVDVPMAGTSVRGFVKAGGGTLTLTKAGGFTGGLTVSGGTLRLAELASLPVDAVQLVSVQGEGEGELRLDNSGAIITDRIRDFASIRSLGRGITLIGNASAPVSENLGQLEAGGDRAFITLTAPGTASTVLSFNTYAVPSGRVVFRGDALGGGPSGAFTRVRFPGVTLRNGLLPFALADTSATGSGNSFATYDRGTDAAGVIGVRPLRASEYVSGAVIQNPVNGGSTPATANYFIDGPTKAAGALNALNTLTFADEGRLTLGSGQKLDMTNSPGILAQPGAAAVIEGGNIIMSSVFTGSVAPFYLQGDGDVTLRNTSLMRLPLANRVEVIKLGAGVLTLENAQVADPIKVRNGTLRLGLGQAIGELALESATLALTGASARVQSLEGTGSVLLGFGELTVGVGRFIGAIEGSGGLRVTNTFILSSPATYSGPTRVEGVPASPGAFFNNPPILSLTGSGSALMSSKFIVSGGSLGLGGLGPVASRIGAVPIELNSGAISLGGDSTVQTKQSAGLLTSSGLSNVAVQPSSEGPLTHLEFSGIRRVDRGAFDFDFGSASVANARITFGSGATEALVGAGTTMTNRPILPFALFSPGSLVTYDAITGVRPLDLFTETSNTLSAGSNVRLTSAATVSSDIVINSLINEFGTAVNGPGTLTIDSGVILSFFGSTVIDAPVNFGSAEGHLYGPFSNVLSITGPVAGTNGVTITGTHWSATTELRGQNTFTGPLTVNAGTLRFSSAANLGADTSEIVVNDARLEYAGGSAFTLVRPLRLNGYLASLETSGLGQLTIAGPITGAGGILIQGDVVFTGANNYAGTTSVQGKLTIASDAALASGSLRLAVSDSDSFGLLTLAGAWTTNRTVEIGSNSFHANTIDTAGFDAVLNGPLVSDGNATSSLIKAGAGRLVIAEATKFTSNLTINGGTAAINSAMPAGGTLTAGIGGTLAGTGNIQRTVTINGTLSPGYEGAGMLSTAGMSFANGSTFALEIASESAFDQLNVAGSVSLNGVVNLALTLGFDPDDGIDSFVVLGNDGADAISGTGRFAFAGKRLEEGDTFFVGSQQFRVSYAGGTGNDVVLNAVPEPGTCILLFAASPLLGLRRFRKPKRVSFFISGTG